MPTVKMSPAEEDGKGRYGASNNPLAAVSRGTHRWQGGASPPSPTEPGGAGARWQGQTQIPATPAPRPVLTPPPASVFGLLSLKYFQWCHVIYLEKSAQSLIVQPVELSSSDFSQHQHTFHQQSQALKRSQRATHVRGLASARRLQSTN